MDVLTVHTFLHICLCQAHARKAEQQANVQHIVEKETAGLQVCCVVVQICLKQNWLYTLWCLSIVLQILSFLCLSPSGTNLSFTILMNFKTRIEELQERMEKLKKELKKQRDKESSLLEEKDRLKQVGANSLRVKGKENEVSDFLAFVYTLSILNSLLLVLTFCPADYTISRFL